MPMRRLVLGGLAALLLIGAIIWYMQGGGWQRTQRHIFAATAAAGLQVNDVFITGRVHLPREELNEAIGAQRGDAILGIDLHAIHDRLLQNPWVKAARVERHLPNVLYVALTERVPFAIWQHDQTLALIDATGAVITTRDLESFNGLPLLVGQGAQLVGAGMLSTLDTYPEFRKQLKALVRVSDRRWDVQLENDITIKLPETDPAAALDRLSRVWQTTSISTRRMKVIDARLPDRIIIDGIDHAEQPAAGAAPGATR